MPKSSFNKSKAFAQSILAHEAAARGSARGADRRGFRACEKVRVALGLLMGAAGYEALLSRALELALPGVPWLDELQVRADGALEGWTELKSDLSAEQLAQGELAVLTELLGLMRTFIGAPLTVHLIQDVWPEADFSAFVI